MPPMRHHAVLVVAIASALAACRSPFADWEESGPAEDPLKVGEGIHGWPFYERDPNRHGVRTDVLWPMASVRTSEDGELRRADLLVPIVLWEKDGERSRFGIRPFFDIESDRRVGGEVSDVDLLFPLLKWRTAPGASKFELRPILFTGHDANSEWTHVAPLWFSGSSTRTRRDVKHEEEYRTLFPFWWSGQELVDGHEQRRWNHLWPFYGAHRDGTRNDTWVAAPLVHHGTDSAEELSEWDVLFPIFRASSWKDGSRSWLMPVWFHSRDEDDTWTVLFPLWFSHEAEDESLRFLFPVYGRKTGPGDFERTFWGGNLLITTRDGEKSATDVVWPFFHHESKGEDYQTRLFPVLHVRRETDRSTTHVWPVFGVDRKASSSEYSTVWPFFTYEEWDDGFELNLPAPFVEVKRREHHDDTMVWPLFDHESWADGHYEGNLLLLLANWERDKEGKSDFRILWRLVQSTDTGERKVFAVNPLFRKETNARGDLHWSTLFGLVARTREAEDVRWRLLWFLTL